MANEADSKHWVVWRFIDGRRGHLTQLDGLTTALQDLAKIQVVDFHLPVARPSFSDLILGRYAPAKGKRAPDLILSAGHRTHIAALCARRAHGGRLVVLMKPSLPLSWFDLCLIPTHDTPPTDNNVIATRGVINTVRHSTQHTPGKGLLLIGGPSRHYDWAPNTLLSIITEIIGKQPGVRFVVGDSPRTPDATRHLLKQLESAEYLPWESTQPGEIQQRMHNAGQIWVSEDSVSMLYEALSSGAPTGLLPAPRRKNNRISQGLDQLLNNGDLVAYEDWRAGEPLHAAPDFNEAARCAREIISRWPPTN